MVVVWPFAPHLRVTADWAAAHAAAQRRQRKQLWGAEPPRRAPRTSRRRMRSAASPRRRRRRSSGPSRSRNPVRVKTMPQRNVHAPRGTALQGPAQGSPPCFKPVRRPRGGATQTVGDNYDFHELLGKGAFGFVYRATHRRSGIEYAVSTRVARGFSRPPVLESQKYKYKYKYKIYL